MRISGYDWSRKDRDNYFCERAREFYEQAQLWKYFRVVTSHHSDFFENIGERECHIYFRTRDDYLPIKKVDGIALEVEPGTPGVFYDWMLGDRILLYGHQAVVIVDKLRGRRLGLWLPEKEVLFLTDWSHNSLCVRAAVPAFKQLVEKLGIKPLFEDEKQQKRRPKINITVGADPEFELINSNGGVTYACRVITDSGYCEPIGLDGAEDQVELRPEPGTPAAVVKNIRELVNRFANEYKEYDLSPVGDTLPCGGHIHIGGVPDVTGDLISLLDDFIGKPTARLSGSARGDYGGLGNYEMKEYGFEYRTPPALIFSNPRIARIMLKLARNLVERYFTEDEIEYNDQPTVEDYKKVGGLTDKEVQYFMSFTKNPTRKTMRAAWGAPTLKRKSRTLGVEFRDEWAEYVKNKLCRALIMLFKKAHCKRPRRLVLYGLRSDRGEVATIPIEGMDLIDNVVRCSGNTSNAIWIGLPYSFRLDPFDADEQVMVVAKAIVRYVRKVMRIEREVA